MEPGVSVGGFVVAREGRRDRRRGWWVARGSKGGWNAPRRAAAKPDGDGLSFCSASAASSLSILSVLLQPFLYLVFFLRIPFLLLRLVVHPLPSFPLSFLRLSLSLSLFHPVNFRSILSLLHSDPPLPRLTCLLFPRARHYALSFIPCDPPLFLPFSISPPDSNHRGPVECRPVNRAVRLVARSHDGCVTIKLSIRLVGTRATRQPASLQTPPT